MSVLGKFLTLLLTLEYLMILIFKIGQKTYLNMLFLVLFCKI